MSTAVTVHKPINHDLPTLLRLSAITLIVSGHFGLFEYGGGGATLLMLIVGYNIATFKLSKVLQTGSVIPVAMMIIKSHDTHNSLCTINSIILRFVQAC